MIDTGCSILDAGCWMLVVAQRPPARRTYGSERNLELVGMVGWDV